MRSRIAALALALLVVVIAGCAGQDQIELTHTGGEEPAVMAYLDKKGNEHRFTVESASVHHELDSLGEVARFRVYSMSGELLASTECERQEGYIHDAQWWPWENRVECVIRH